MPVAIWQRIANLAFQNAITAKTAAMKSDR